MVKTAETHKEATKEKQVLYFSDWLALSLGHVQHVYYMRYAYLIHVILHM